MPINESGDVPEELPTKKGTAGEPKLSPPADSVAPAAPPPTLADEERQRRIGERRKPSGPPRLESDATPSATAPSIPPVPPTECAEGEPEAMGA